MWSFPAVCLLGLSVYLLKILAIMVVWFDADASPPPALPVARSARVESHWNTQAAPSVTVVLAAVSLRAQTAKAPATNSVGI